MARWAISRGAFPTGLRGLLVAVAAGQALLYATTVLRRVAYPFSLEWMESGAYDTVMRLAHGLPVYVRPSLEYIPYNYTPLYYYACTPFVRLLGEAFLPLRLVSVLASVGTLVLVLLIVRRVVGGLLPGLVAACTLAATFQLTGGYTDVARPDSLYVFLLTAGLASLVSGGTRPLAAVAAGVLFGAAYLTKQSALPSVVLFLGYLVLRRPRTGLPVALTFVLLVGASTAWLARSTDNWYTYYTLKIATGYSVLFARLPYFWIRYVGPLAVSALLGALWLMWRGRERRDTSELLAVGLANIALASWWLSLYPGTAHNVAIPAAMVLAVLLGLGTGTVLRLARDVTPDTGRRLESITYLACAIQLVALGYDPAKLVPTSQDVAAGRQLVRFLATRDGDVLVPNHSYLARMAGKAPHYHSMALANTLHNDRSGSVLVAAREIQRALDSGHYGTIVLDASNRGMLDAVPGYGPERALFRDPDVFMTRVGERTRPEFARTRIAPALAR